MKKLIRLGVGLTALMLLLSACANVAEQPNSGTIESTSPTVPTVTDPTTVPTTAPTNVPTESVPATEEEAFQKLINDEYWYWRALGCTFEKPKDISLQHLFYSGIPKGAYHSSTFTAEEQAAIDAAYIKKNGKEPFTAATKLPVTEINKALSVLGVTLADVQIPDSWIYYDKTDSWYFWKSDAYGVVGWTVTEVVKNTDGTVQVHWESKEGIWNTQTNTAYPNGTKMVMTLKERSDSTYLVLSNVPQK